MMGCVGLKTWVCSRAHSLVRKIGLPGPENLNVHVRPHRTRRGGANLDFKASRV